jgi:hypothetical protein
MKTEQILNKIERRFRKYYIPGLMGYVIFGMVIVFIMDAIICPMTGRQPLYPFIQFSRSAIMHGQVWRLISFVFEPITYSPLFFIFTMYFYWMIGSVLENNWGSFRFNLYFFTSLLGAIIAGFITGTVDNYYMMLTMFLAFAVIAPDLPILLFFFIPVKIKYIAYVDAAVLLISFILAGFSGKIAILLSVINFLLFFGEAFMARAKMRINHWKFKMKNRR